MKEASEELVFLDILITEAYRFLSILEEKRTKAMALVPK